MAGQNMNMGLTNQGWPETEPCCVHDSGEQGQT